MSNENLSQQAALYGAPLSARFGHIRTELKLTQARMAEVLGISAPMLSQLISGQRIKIGNPLVALRFEELSALADEVSEGLALAEVEPRLSEIRHITTTVLKRVPPSDPATLVQQVLRAVASGQELHSAADLLHDSHPALADAIRIYGTASREEARRHLASIAHLLQ